jgi:hypothetical protein
MTNLPKRPSTQPSGGGDGHGHAITVIIYLIVFDLHGRSPQQLAALVELVSSWLQWWFNRC